MCENESLDKKNTAEYNKDVKVTQSKLPNY